MEKRCEFCMALRPVVYCKSDAAHLCLSCDAKVHSANALSYRHPRTLVCESCRYHPSHVRCIDHEMFMCQSCDAGHHVGLEHRRRVVGCYVGCPSAKDLAGLWGFDLKDFDSNCTESGGGSSSRGTKVVNDDSLQKSSYMILQQILDLERLQLSEGVDNSCLVNVKERTGGSPFRHDTMLKEHKMLDSHPDSFNGQMDSFGEKAEEPLSSPFTQLDSFASSSNPLNGDSFWQYKSPLHNNEIWLQNMQDLGVCDEVRCLDDVNIPDVDLTFRNFEELFGNEHEPSRAVVNDDDMACSFADKHPSSGKLGRGCTSAIEEPKKDGKEIVASDKVYQSQSNHRRPVWPSYSASSFSVSRITGESSGSEYKDDGLSPTFSENPRSDSKEIAITRIMEKKVLRHEKQAHSTSPRSKSDFKKRGRSQVVLKMEGLEREIGNVTRSF